MPGTPGPDGLAGTPDPAVPELVGRAAEVATVRRLLGGSRRSGACLAGAGWSP